MLKSEFPITRSPMIATLLLVVALGAPMAGLATPAGAIPPLPRQTDAGPAVTAEGKNLGPSKGLESPRATLTTLFEAFPSDDEARIPAAVACFPESALPPEGAVRDRTVTQVTNLLEWLGWRTPEMLARVPAMVAGDEPGTFTLFPWKGEAGSRATLRSTALSKAIDGSEAVELRRGPDGAWRFNPDSLSAGLLDNARTAMRQIRIDEGESPALAGGLEDWIVSLQMPWLTNKVAFIEIWQWFGLGAIILLGLFVDLALRLFGSRYVRHVVHRIHDQTDDLTIRRAVRGIGLVGSTAIWLLLIPMLDLPLVAFGVLQPAAKLAFILALFWMGWRGTDLLGEIMLGRALRSETKADDVLVPMVRKTLKVILVSFALLNLSPLLGLDLGPLIAAIGIGSFGFAFAFKNSLENLFGSVTVILDRPFQVGDWIIVEGIEGTVETVGIRSTRIRTFYNSVVSLPNSNLVTSKVDNYGLRKYRRWKSTIGILYGTPVPRIEAFCEGIRELVREHPYTRKDYYQVWVNEFGPSSIDILIYVFWEAPDWQTELRERHRFMIDIMRLAEAVGVDFAFPSQTIYLERGGEKAAPKDPSIDDLTDGREALRKGRETVRAMTSDAPWRSEDIPKYRFLDADETKRIDSIDDQAHAARVESTLERSQQPDLPSEIGEDPENPDYTEQRDAGG